MAERKLTVVLAGEDRSLSKTLDGAGSSAETTNSKFGTFAKGVAAAFAFDKVLDFGRAVSGAASDMGETLSKSNTIFGTQAKEIEKWASGAAKSFGQSKQEALDAAAGFGNMFSQLGIGIDKAAGMSTQMTELASDFASFHNADITEVLEAQAGAFRNEYDSIQRFVPTINAAAVEQKALEMGLGATTKELDQQDKALATQTLLMEGAGAAMGDFDRTSDSAANKQRILSAQWKDAQATLGTLLLPAISAITGALSGLIGWMEQHRGAAAALGIVVGTVLVIAFVAWAASAAAAAAATIAAMAPVLAITAAIAALAAGVIYAYTHWDGFRAVVDTVAQFLTGVLWPALQQVIGFITGTVIPVVVQIITTFVQWHLKVAEVAAGIISWVAQIVAKVIAVGAGIASAIAGIVTKFGEWLSKGQAVASGVVSAFQSVVSFFTGLPATLGKLASEAWNALKKGLKEAIDWIIHQIDRALGPLDELVGGLGKVVGGAGKAIGGVVGKIPGLASGGWAGSGQPMFGPRGTDIIPAWLSPGEYVLNADAAKSFGGRFLAMLNGGASRFAPFADAFRSLLRGDITGAASLAGSGLDGLLGTQGMFGDLAKRLSGHVGPAPQQMYRQGEISDAEWSRLMAQGWRGDPTDNMEAIYAPGHVVGTPAGSGAGGIHVDIRVDGSVLTHGEDLADLIRGQLEQVFIRNGIPISI